MEAGVYACQWRPAQVRSCLVAKLRANLIFLANYRLSLEIPVFSTHTKALVPLLARSRIQRGNCRAAKPYKPHTEVASQKGWNNQQR